MTNYYNADEGNDCLDLWGNKLTGYCLSACENRRGTICPHVQIDGVLVRGTICPVPHQECTGLNKTQTYICQNCESDDDLYI